LSGIGGWEGECIWLLMEGEQNLEPPTKGRDVGAHLVEESAALSERTFQDGGEEGFLALLS
jgi:hypothetical protein